MVKSRFTDDDDALLEKLGVEVEAKKTVGRTQREERIIAGFEEIQRFVEQHGRLPAHGEDNDIFERLYATRLDQIRGQEECRAILQGLDHQGLLDASSVETETPLDDIDDDELLSRLGVAPSTASDVTILKHVKSRAEVRAAEEIANRTPCEDFDIFKPLFQKVQKELDNGIRETRNFVKDAGFLKADINKGHFFILGGQTAYVANIYDPIKAPNGEFDSRLRVIYSNGTESNLLLRSLQRALYKDETGRRISNPSAGPLFSDQSSEEDLASGTIYVLQSKSDHPVVRENREIIHKIGVTGGSVEKRIANARLDPTFLMDDVEVVATYELYNINRAKLENIIHKFFSAAQLDIQIKDRFGNPVSPKEWFLVPLFAVDDAVDKIRDGTIRDYLYDVENAKLTLRKEQ